MTRERRPARPEFSSADLGHMQEALALAERGRGTTHPNPVVGAVIVKDGAVIARGHHERAGGPHAEVVALGNLPGGQTGEARGATLYVTLEPCCHTGRTGPCTEAVIAAGISRVVVACLDENPLVSGRGVARLRRAGVLVDVGCREDEARAQNRGFFRWIRDRRPHVTLKAAASLDGFLAPAGPRKPGTIHWLTGPSARARAHHIRARHDAIIVGAGTIAADDPRLTIRLPEHTVTEAKRADAHFLRVVLDGLLRTSPSARVFTQRGARRPLVIGAKPQRLAPAAARAFARRERALATKADVVLLPGNRAGAIEAAAITTLLAQRQVQSLLLEGGSRLHATFINAGLVDEVALFLAPQLLGGGVPIAAGPGLPADQPLRLGPLQAVAVAGDILVTANVIRDFARQRR
ncbi:MAG TPA: bifunctional diaminohydroxyphosphoribosylaminopyrimidine deaminase/5-amino-6-(5-phosphoribosylamino)uracil reductase RibD [Polyangia bacterium]